MSALQKFKTFFSKNVLLCLTVPMVVFSLLVPQPFVWMGQNISIDLSGIPFLRKLPELRLCQHAPVRHHVRHGHDA